MTRIVFVLAVHLIPVNQIYNSGRTRHHWPPACLRTAQSLTRRASGQTALSSRSGLSLYIRHVRIHIYAKSYVYCILGSRAAKRIPSNVSNMLYMHAIIEMSVTRTVVVTISLCFEHLVAASRQSIHRFLPLNRSYATWHYRNRCVFPFVCPIHTSFCQQYAFFALFPSTLALRLGLSSFPAQYLPILRSM